MASKRDLPRIDSLIACWELASYPRKLRLEAARVAVARIRAMNPLPENLENEAKRLALEEASKRAQSSLRPIINASGVILHTGAGRARLAREAAEQVHKVALSHSNVELDLDSGKRGDRQTHVREALRELTGADDAFIVNNCAAAVFLALHALAFRREVILSRGQMVEIGGSFRLPDIVRQSGCRLVEIGTTNKTRLEDYANAITGKTALILRCHPSNFRVVGFTEEPALPDLAKLAHERGIMFMDDVGSGCLVDTSDFGLPSEPRIGDSLSMGADIVTASGDKLLGGPQAGLILGRQDFVSKIKRHPLARIVRIDKLTLAALEATLRLYSTGLEHEIPTLSYLSRPLEEVRGLATQLQQAYRGESILADGITEVGGGSLPGAGIPTVRVGLKAVSPNALARVLRKSNPPVLARIEDGQVWIDPRTLDLTEVKELTRILGGLP